MEKLDLNLIQQKIDQMSLNTWKMYQNKEKENNSTNSSTTTNTTSDSLSINSERDNRLNSSLNEVKNNISTNTTASTGLAKMKEFLDSLRSTAVKAQSGTVTDTEKTAATTALSNIDKTVADSKVKDTSVLSKYDTESLGLSNLDITSKDAVDKIDKALSAVKTAEESYESRLEKNKEVLNSLNEKKELYGKADELMNSIKSDMASNSLTAVLSQSNGLTSKSVYDLLSQY